MELETKKMVMEQAEQFFTWPGDDKTVVTYASTLLFAEHCVREAMRDEAIRMELAYVNGRHQGFFDRMGDL